MEKKLSYNFWLDLKKPKGEQYPIYMRLSMNRRKHEYSVGFSINLNNWDKGKQRAKSKASLHEEINEKLSSLEKKVIDIKKSLEKENKLVTALLIKEILIGKNKIDAFVIESFNSYKTLLDKKGKVKEISIKRYDETKNHLINFLKTKKLNDIDVKYINYSFIQSFDLFLSQIKVKNTERVIDVNTKNKHHSRFRTILLQAQKEGFINNNPYAKFPLVNTPSTIDYLEEEELKKIMKHELAGNESLRRIRDIFVFSCFTGLRFTDAMDLTMSSITIDKKNKYWLKTTQNKNSQFLGIPILKEAIEIIKKYDGSPEREIKMKVLPQISNQKFNVYIKEIANLVGITKNLHHHVARHTCGTFLLSQGYSIEQVGEWLGQKSTRTTKIYAKITGVSLDHIRAELDARKK